MRRITSLAFVLTCFAAPLAAWETPARGTETRSALMDAMRPHAEWLFNAPLVFRVNDLRQQGDVAFAMLEPIRPDGRPMAPSDLVIRGTDADDIFDYDGAAMQALYQRSGDTWVAVHWTVGATDAWWYWTEYCATWSSVLPEVCD
ncbi:hypothetical protein J4E08_09300 [Sagittula sp. NFXS13]|uniref:hypothetical protein n=1 Tax=Sagittula sp. NFXS13 TaxID=2819095 RepID=UPI0032E0188D